MILLVSLHALSSLTPSQSINAILPLLCKYAKHRLIMQCLSLVEISLDVTMFPISNFQSSNVKF
jgi:hypothetical protein